MYTGEGEGGERQKILQKLGVIFISKSERSENVEFFRSVISRPLYTVVIDSEFLKKTRQRKSRFWKRIAVKQDFPLYRSPRFLNYAITRIGLLRIAPRISGKRKKKREKRKIGTESKRVKETGKEYSWYVYYGNTGISATVKPGLSILSP